MTWKILNLAFSAGFTLSWQAKLFFTVVGAFSIAWPIVGLVPRYRIIQPGDPPTVSNPISVPPKRSMGAIVSPKARGSRNKPGSQIRRGAAPSVVTRPKKDY